MEKVIHMEVAINAAIRHPNIVQLIAVTEDVHSFYLIYKYIHGCNMDNAIFSSFCKAEIQLNDNAQRLS